MSKQIYFFKCYEIEIFILFLDPVFILRKASYTKVKHYKFHSSTSKTYLQYFEFYKFLQKQQFLKCQNKFGSRARLDNFKSTFFLLQCQEMLQIRKISYNEEKRLKHFCISIYDSKTSDLRITYWSTKRTDTLYRRRLLTT